MFNKNNWKETIYKNDVITVIIFGLTATILGGIFAGLVDAAITKFFDSLGINFGITVSLLLCSLFVGFSVKKGYESYHILYPVLALGFMIVALFFSQVAYQVGYEGIQSLGSTLSSGEFYLYVLILPFNYLRLMIILGKFSFVYFIYLIINILFYVLAFIAAYKIAKGRN